MAKELAKTRTTIEDLEEKAERNERLALDLEHRFEREGSKDSEETLKLLTQTRAHLAKLEKTQKQQGVAVSEKLTKTATNYAALTRRIQDTESKQEDLTEKVESASAQQAKLIRKVDKAIEDRARFMRKIERIEETVLQTRDSLNAKAMVLLTDQDVAGDAGTRVPDQFSDPQTWAQQESAQINRTDPITLAAQKNKAAAERVSAVSQPAPQQGSAWKIAASIAGVILIGGLGLVLINNLKTSQNAAYQTPDADRFLAATPQAAEWQPVEVNPQTVPQPQPIEQLDWAIEETPAADTTPDIVTEAIESQTATTAPIQLQNDDVGAIDLQNEEQVAALLEENPQALAQELNAIEPQRIQQPEAAPTTQAAATQTVVEAPKPEPVTTPPPAKSENQLRSLIKADTALPNVVKTIEDQAFSAIPEAQHDLAAIYTAGHGGVTQDYKRAAFWFERAAENGIANASYNLGVLHHQGLGFSPNIDKALTWYKKASAQGHPEAQYNLGIAYIEGIGVEYNPKEAAQNFETAAQGGVMEAAYNLGLIYENGLLGGTKPNEALLWYKTAADQGSPEAQQALEDLAKTLEIDVKDINRIVDQAKDQPAPLATDDRQGSLTTPVLLNSGANNQTLVVQIQDYLMKSGLYPGPADGVTGPLTQDAIRSYQSLNGLTPSGAASQTLLSHMLSNANEFGSRIE